MTVTPRAERTIASHVERVAQADALATRQRGAMYDAIDTLVAAGELTTEAAAERVGVSRPTLMRALAANRAAKALATPDAYE